MKTVKLSNLWIARINNDHGCPVKKRTFHTLRKAKAWLASVELAVGQVRTIQAD